MFPVDTVSLVDGYKLDHRRQYPDHTEEVYSNFTPRGSRIEGQEEVVFLGLQGFIQRFLMDELKDFFNGDIDEICQDYADLVNGYLGPNTIGTDHIRVWHALGYVPLEFRALPEGTKVPLRVPMFTVRSTHGDDFAWLANYYESVLSAEIWGPCTSATTALRLRNILEKYARLTGSALEFVDWQGHDFSFRGMFGLEAAKLSGMGHLVFFNGTDTIPAIGHIKKYYGVPDNYLLAGSVPATEHSVMCAGGQDDELGTFNRLLDLYPSGIVSVVSDTWDLWHVVDPNNGLLVQLKDRVMSREGKLVIRPDSGDPVKIICGDPAAYPGSPAFKGVIECLWETFGGVVTSTGHKLLDGHIGCIYGDSINEDRMTRILQGLADKGFSSGNMVFGVGSFTYQYVTRDVYNFAMKATRVKIAGVTKDIFKKPITDDGTKNSAKGTLAVILVNGKLTLLNQATEAQDSESLLKIVWKDGVWLQKWSFDQVRANARK